MCFYKNLKNYIIMLFLALSLEIFGPIRATDKKFSDSTLLNKAYRTREVNREFNEKFNFKFLKKPTQFLPKNKIKNVDIKKPSNVDIKQPSNVDIKQPSNVNLKQPSDEFLKHLIISATISILESEELGKINEVSTEINNCIAGTADWKKPITKEMLLGIGEKIFNAIQKSPNNEDPRRKFTKEEISTYINKNKDLFNNIFLLHLPKEYQKSLKFDLEGIKENIKYEEDYYYLYVNNEKANKENSSIQAKEKPLNRFKKMPKKEKEKPSWRNLWGILIKQDFGADEETEHKIENENNDLKTDFRIRYGNKDIKEPSNQVEIYKIHLMPKIEELSVIIKMIIKSDILKNMVIGVKFRQPLKIGWTAGYECPAQWHLYNPEKKCFCANVGAYDVGPMIVIYTSKDNAQAALKKVFELFKEKIGLNLTPQFNKKINSLIYYAQGNSISKIFNPDLFEKPNLVHYLDNITSTKFNRITYKEIITKQYAELTRESDKEHSRYHLKNPALGIASKFKEKSKEKSYIKKLQEIVGNKDETGLSILERIKNYL